MGIRDSTDAVLNFALADRQIFAAVCQEGLRAERATEARLTLVQEGALAREGIEALGRRYRLVVETLPPALLDEVDWMEVIETFYDVADLFWQTGREEDWGIACAMARAERRAICSAPADKIVRNRPRLHPPSF